MSEILLIRHGQTDYNVAGKFGGFSDISLNQTGREQALLLSRGLQNEKIDYFYSSDLKRCVETGQGLKPVNEKIFLQDLREMNFGLWEGLTFDEIREKYPDDFQKWENNRSFASPGGESFVSMSERVLKVFDGIVMNHNGKEEKTAIVTHGGCICAILGMKIAGSLEHAWKFNPANALVTRLFVSDEFISLKSFNEKIQ